LTNNDNRALWIENNLEDFDLAAEAYLSIDYTDVHYLSDTGRNWSGRYSIKDEVDKPSSIRKKINNTEDLICFIDGAGVNKLCLNIHPKRWADNSFEWFYELITQSVKNTFKLIIKKSKNV
jgi:hypothetical protein